MSDIFDFIKAFSIAGMCIFLSLWAGIYLVKGVMLAVRKFKSKSKTNNILSLIAIALMTLYAGSKPLVYHFSFAAGLRDDGSYCTNDLVHVEWIKSGVPYVPNSATVYVDYRLIGSTNEWLELGEAKVTDYRKDFTVLNATGYVYNVWWYDDSEDVHTNGVWAYTLMNSKSGNPNKTDRLDAIPIKAEVVGDGTIISTPSKKGHQTNATR